MEKEITRTLLFSFAGGAVLCLLAFSRSYSDVQARTDETQAHTDSLHTRERYKLLVTDRSRYLMEDSLSWGIVGLYTGHRSFFLNNTIKEHAFDDTGHYVVSAYRSMVEIARDTLLVIEGEKFEPRWPDVLTDTVGATFQFTDYSQQAESTEWRIMGPDSMPVTSAETDFKWTPAIPGTYLAQVRVKFRSGNDETLTQELTVETPKPVALVRKPVAPVPYKPRPKPQPRKPRVDPPEPTNISISCFGKQMTKLTRAVTVQIEEPDNRAELNYKNTPVSFLVTPKVDCALSRFTYYTKSTGSKVKITIKCITPPPGYTGNVEYERHFEGGFDAYKATFHELENMPVLFAGLKYKVTITPITGQMGYFPTGSNKFKEVDESGRVRMNGTGITFTDAEETCLFNVVFKCAE